LGCCTVCSKYVRDEHLLTLEEAIRKMTPKAAARVLDRREVWCILTRFKAKFTKQSQGFAQEEQ
jgi:hypothetical protein